MEPSDSTKKTSHECGVTSLPSCDKRGQGHSHFARRGFIGGLALLATAGSSAGRSLAGTIEDQATVSEAILYVRRVNALEVRYNTINGRYTESVTELELPDPPVGWSLDIHAKSNDWTVLLTQDRDNVVIYSTGSGRIRKGILSFIGSED